MKASPGRAMVGECVSEPTSPQCFSLMSQHSGLDAGGDTCEPLWMQDWTAAMVERVSANVQARVLGLPASVFDPACYVSVPKENER